MKGRGESLEQTPFLPSHDQKSPYQKQEQYGLDNIQSQTLFNSTRNATIQFMMKR